MKDFVDIYRRATIENNSGYLLLDLTAPEVLQLRSRIADEGPCEVAYSW